MCICEHGIGIEPIGCDHHNGLVNRHWVIAFLYGHLFITSGVGDDLLAAKVDHELRAHRHYLCYGDRELLTLNLLIGCYSI